MKATISNLFYLKRAKANSKGLVPIFHRVTVNGKRIEKSTGKFIDPAKWSVEGAKMKGTSEEARLINGHLDDLKNEVAEAEKHFYNKGESVDYENMKNRLLGLDVRTRTIVPIFKEHNKRIKALIEVDEYAVGTLERYETSLSHTIEFMKWKYKLTDIDITKIDHAFVMDYDFYLRTERGCNNNTTVKYLKNFQKIINICLDNKWLTDNPFVQYKFKVHEVDIEFLDENEISTIFTKKFVSERLSEVRDIFIFCCFTGLAYIDVKQLKQEHIGIDIDGQRWIYKKNQKTDTASNI